MKYLLFLLFFSTQFGFCQLEKNVSEYAKSISSKELKELLYVYASDYFEGRETGKRGQHKAVDFIRQFYIKHNITAAKGTEYYFQPMTLNIKGEDVKTENVVAIIEGSEYPLLIHLAKLNSLDLVEEYQIQFHNFIPDAIPKRDNIIEYLSQTHKRTWCYYFVWENWKKFK